MNPVETKESSAPRRGGGLPPEAYEEIPGTEYVPYVPASQSPREFTLRAILVGIVIGILLGAANAYLGLRVGLTVSASIPAAVVAVALFRILKGGTILEANIVQTVGSSGESLAAGVIFTIPAFFLFGLSPSYALIFTLAVLGGTLGVLFMIPLRRYLIRDEHGRLPYPEGTACAEVLAAGDSGGSKAKLLFAGLGLGAVYQYLVNPNALSLWRDEPAFRIPGYPKAEFGVAVTPELLGVGYIIGPRIASYLFAGSAISWLVLIPLIGTFGAAASAPLYPETELLIGAMEPGEIWNRYIRYLGAGAVAFGGLATLFRSLPVIWQSFVVGLGGLREAAADTIVPRTDDDISLKVVLGGAVLVAIILVALPASFAPVGVLGAALMVLFSFFFVTVSSRIVGLIGQSSNPISGMTIATLLFTSLLFVWLDVTGGGDQRVAILLVGAIICIAAALAGDCSQDLKTGFLVGSTPRLQQWGELIAIGTAATVMAPILYILHGGLGIGSEALPAPQATLMALVIEGVVSADLPWALVIAGVVIAAIFELAGLPSLVLAVGLYLPLSLMSPILAGGIVRLLIEKRNARRIGVLREKRENGVLFASGLIAGAALVGVLIAGIVFGAEQSPGLASFQAVVTGLTDGVGAWISLVIFFGLAATLWYVAEHGHSGGDVSEDLEQAEEM